MELDWHAARSDFDELCLLEAETPKDDIDLLAVRRYRLDRVRNEMRRREIAACILVDPVNIRYASGARNMQVFTARNPGRYLLVTLEGPVILYEFTGCAHLARDLETITEIRPAMTASFVAAGPAIVERERTWAEAMASTLNELVGRHARIGIERVNAGAAQALAGQGFALVDAQEPVEMARTIKSEEELKCVRASVRATELGVARLRAAIQPGMTENALWSVLHQAIIEQGGDYIETRLLNSGPRTNPWFQETGARTIGANELIALDTDVVGCFGYYSDFSRTFHSGPDRPTPAQRELYRIANEQVQHNIGIIRTGMSFRDYADLAWEIPERFFANRYYLSAHGCGMTGEYPYLYHRADFPDAGYDGIIQPGMTLCVESYIGAEGGQEGVKLEEQILVTESGIEQLSQFPYETELLR